jgi:hypothetical protein
VQYDRSGNDCSTYETDYLPSDDRCCVGKGAVETIELAGEGGVMLLGPLLSGAVTPDGPEHGLCGRGLAREALAVARY